MNNKKIDIVKINLIRIYFLVVFFEAFFRYIFQKLGLIHAIYVKDAIIIFVFILSTFKIENSKRFYIFLFISFFSILIACVYIDNYKQIVLGIIKVLLIFWDRLFK